MAEIKFTHKVSKGTRFNQIYIPLGMKGKFDVGDVVTHVFQKQSRKFYALDHLWQEAKRIELD